VKPDAKPLQPIGMVIDHWLQSLYDDCRRQIKDCEGAIQRYEAAIRDLKHAANIATVQKTIVESAAVEADCILDQTELVDLPL